MADQADITDSEIWKPVLHWEGLYEVSSFGRIRSLDRTIYRKNGVPMRHRGKVMRPTLNSGRGGRLSVQLRDGSRVMRREVHVLVCQSFSGPKPHPAMDAAHWDGDTKNNKAGNLRWATRKENMEDAKRHGTLWRGGSAIRPAYSEAIKAKAIKAFMGGATVKDVMNEYNLSHSTAYRLRRNNHW